MITFDFTSSNTAFAITRSGPVDTTAVASTSCCAISGDTSKVSRSMPYAVLEPSVLIVELYTLFTGFSASDNEVPFNCSDSLAPLSVSSPSQTRNVAFASGGAEA